MPVEVPVRHLDSRLSILVVRCLRHVLSAIACLFIVNGTAHAQLRARVAVLDFGDSVTGARAADEVRKGLADRLSTAVGISVIDHNLSAAAARGNGFQGSLNLTTQEARDL